MATCRNFRGAGDSGNSILISPHDELGVWANSGYRTRHRASREERGAYPAMGAAAKPTVQRSGADPRSSTNTHRSETSPSPSNGSTACRPRPCPRTRNLLKCPFLVLTSKRTHVYYCSLPGPRMPPGHANPASGPDSAMNNKRSRPNCHTGEHTQRSIKATLLPRLTCTLRSRPRMQPQPAARLPNMPIAQMIFET